MQITAQQNDGGLCIRREPVVAVEQKERIDYSSVIAHRYPRSFKAGNVYGTGPHLLISRCNPRRWVVYCFYDLAKRAAKAEAWADKNCCSGCTGNHQLITL